MQVMLYRDTSRVLVETTDFDGRFSFHVLPGHYMLVAKTVGYLEYRREVDIKAPTAMLDTIVIAPSAKQLEEIEISCERLAGIISIDPADTARVYQELRSVWLEGVVKDSLTKEPLPFFNVIVKKDGKYLTGTCTDFDGNFKLQLEKGEYEFVVSEVGYARKRIPVKVMICRSWLSN